MWKMRKRERMVGRAGSQGRGLGEVDPATRNLREKTTKFSALCFVSDVRT